MAGRHRAPGRRRAPVDAARVDQSRRGFFRYVAVGAAVATVGTGTVMAVQSHGVDTPVADTPLTLGPATTAAPPSSTVPPSAETPNVPGGPPAPVNPADPQPTRTPVEVPEINVTPVNACSPTSRWGVKPHVARAGHQIAGVFGLKDSEILGYRATAVDMTGHPAGLGLDLMVSSRAEGDRIAKYVVERWDLYAVKYVIFWQSITEDKGSTWSLMADRGSVTANHKDHVHVSFEAKGSGELIVCA